MKKWLIAGAITFLIGLIIAGSSFGALKGDTSRLNTNSQYEKKVKIVENQNQSITIDDTNMPFEIDQSPDDKIHFIYYENENEDYTINEADGISFNKNIRFEWNGFFQINLQRVSFTILLPSEYSGDVDVKTSNGSIKMKNIVADEVLLKTNNSSCDIENTQVKNLTAISSNGKIQAHNSSVLELCDLSTSNSKISVDALNAFELVARTSNGGIELDAANIGGDIDLQSSNGAITLIDLSYKGDAVIKTSNSSVKGNILARMSDFYINSRTSNGSNNLPENAEMGSQLLEVKTSNGSISISFNK